MGIAEDRVTASCSFCLKPDHEVAKLVAGPGVYICNECVDLCRQVIGNPPPMPPGITSWDDDLDLDGVLASLPRNGGGGYAGRAEPVPLRSEGESARGDLGGHRGVTGDDKTVGMGAILWRGVVTKYPYP